MAEMVERVAAALFDDEYNGRFVHSGVAKVIFGRDRITYAEVVKGVEEGVYTESALSNHRRKARVVIEAMRDPTDEMNQAGESASVFAIGGPQPVWHEMIDAALKDPEQVG